MLYLSNTENDIIADRVKRSETWTFPTKVSVDQLNGMECTEYLLADRGTPCGRDEWMEKISFSTEVYLSVCELSERREPNKEYHPSL
ncbi:hypothetical protein BDV40DRAFT_106741 [Aspergillus tamarii]|uniref:Uncharacterized protein n=1 Tax=Aspergillus tamarii TaxID=41984 RepID=A0A5N6V172_ASPTM|nr:hypothetical protein BDV40DRAFT_106741 [Aspergillus tamarii]